MTDAFRGMSPPARRALNRSMEQSTFSAGRGPSRAWRAFIAVNQCRRPTTAPSCRSVGANRTNADCGVGGPWPLIFDAAHGLDCGAAHDQVVVAGQLDGQGVSDTSTVRERAAAPRSCLAGSHPAAPVVQTLVRTDAAVGRVP